MKTLALLFPLAVALAYCTGSSQATDALLCRGNGFALYGSHCLKYVSSMVTWYNAKTYCLTDDTLLFYPTTSEEYDLAFDVLEDNGAQYTWLGVRKLNSYGNHYRTSDYPAKNFANLWSGGSNPDLLSSDNSWGYLELTRASDGAQSFEYQRHYTTWYYWWYYTTYPKCPYICRKDPCSVSCDRLEDLIDAFSALLTN